jgi:hypothetical protein
MYQYKLKKGSKSKHVKTLKLWLNDLVQPSPNLKIDEQFDQSTHEAVIKFETTAGLTPADGVVDAKTWAAMGKQLGYDAERLDRMAKSLNLIPPLLMPTWLSNLAIAPMLLTGTLKFSRSTFFEMYMEEYGPLSSSKFQGLEGLLDNIESDPDIRDVRWAAYMLATVKHECADTWQPIEEYGKGSGRDYGKAVKVKGSDGKEYNHAYYGRGYVQLTWKDNYEKMSKAFGMGDELVINPARVMEPYIAYRIMSYGMRNGSFTGKKLSDYIHDTTCDYKNARKIINGLDQWEKIKEYAEKLEAMLKASLSLGSLFIR